MLRYAQNPKQEKSVKIYGRNLRISRKSSVIVCRALTGRNLDKGKSLLENLIAQKESLDGKYYTNVAKELSFLLTQTESSAEFKGLDTSRLFIHASAHKGFTFWRPRRFKFRRRKRKMTNIQLVLEQR